MGKVKIVEQHPTGAFRESSPRSGRREAVLIEAGWGSSGYYSEEVLSEYGPVAWPIGTHMYLNHQTLSEETERPERDIRDWVGTIAGTPRMAGIQLVSEAEVFDHWKPVIDSIAGEVGLSVVAPGTMEHGDAGGRHGPIVKEIHHSPINSVDFVTLAGAGGRLGTLIESARSGGAVAAQEVDEEAELWLIEAAPRDIILMEAEFEKLMERDVGTAERISLAGKGQAIPIRDSSGNITGGRFPMANCGDVSNAAQSVGRTNEPGIKAFITRVASKLSCPKPFQESISGRQQSKGANMELDELQQKLSEAQDENRQLKNDVEESKTKLSEAETSRDEQKDRADRAEDALLSSGAKTIAREAVSNIEGLPERAIDRIVEAAVRGELPKDEQGKLINEKVKETALAKAREELEYLAGEKLEGDLPIRESGFSSSTTTTTTTNGGGQSEEQLVESFQAAGLSEDAAKIAAKGR